MHLHLLKYGEWGGHTTESYGLNKICGVSSNVDLAGKNKHVIILLSKLKIQVNI